MTVAADRLALGTAQFGAAYGVSNRNGQVAPDLAMRLLDRAADALPSLMLDTAPSYGTAEALIGEWSASRGIAPQIVTKTSAPAERLQDELRASLARLGCARVYAVLDHNAERLLGADGSEVNRSLMGLKEQGLADRIGTSVYDADQIDRLLECRHVDVIQVPLSIVDQRLLQSGHMRKLKDRGIEVHVRSVFLQGALLMRPEALPAHLEALRARLSALHEEARQRGVPCLQLLLGFVLGLEEVDRVFVGVTQMEELDDILACAQPARVSSPERFAVGDARLVNPALWA